MISDRMWFVIGTMMRRFGFMLIMIGTGIFMVVVDGRCHRVMMMGMDRVVMGVGFERDMNVREKQEN